MKWVLTIYLMLMCQTFFNQTNYKFDSLYTKLNTANSNNERDKILDQIISITDSKSAPEITRKILLEISRFNKEDVKLETKQLLADLYLILGDAETQQFNYVRGTEYLLKSLTLSEQLKDDNRIANASDFVAYVYNLNLDVPKALYYYTKSLRIRESSKDSFSLARVLNNIAFIYQRNGYAKKAIEFFEKSIRIKELRKDSNGIAMTSINISGLYHDQKKDNKALDLLKRSIAIFRKLKNINGEIIASNNIGAIYFKSGNLREAKIYLKRSLHYSDSLGLIAGKAVSLRYLAEISFTEKDFTDAIKLAQDGLNYSRLSKNFIFVNANALTLKKIYIQQKKYQYAMEMSELSIVMRDSIYKESNRKASFQTALQYDYEKKHLADSLNVRAEKKIIELQLNQEKTKNYFLCLIVAFVFIFSLLLFNRYRLKQEKNQLLIKSQKLVVDNQEKELVKTELDYLRAQINPHFLFNALNTIYFMIDKKDTIARNSLNTFADILRYQLYECDKTVVKIEQEISYLKDYINVQLLRKGSEYVCEFKVSSTVNGFNIAPLLLVPFVENAFNYLSNNPLSKIEIEINKINSDFMFVVKNPKDKNQIKDPNERKGIGINNVKRRLELIYKNAHNLKITETEQEFEVYLSIIL